ncbi:MAG TPA: hypothetical protein VGN12_16430 [Pirellulales bacterium]|jgi:hypothetical protein
MKRFFRLCHGPLDGRTLSPGTVDYQRATRAGQTSRPAFAMPDLAHSGAAEQSPAAEPVPVHLYEPFDRIDEIWLEIVLCKYVGSQQQTDAELN